jgi:hypothetical protein
MKCSLPVLLLALLVFPLLAIPANADPFGAIVIDGPIPNPFPAADPTANANIPADRPAGSLGLTEEEFFYSGAADVYTYAAGNVHLGDKVLKTANAPYKTRMLVRRPPSAADFNGTVVIESMNSTAGFDTTPVWIPSAEYFAREGIVYIGVTTSGNQSIEFLKPHFQQIPVPPFFGFFGCGGLTPSCGSRYASLAMSDNGQEYEMLNQLATALKTNGGPLPGDFGPVERVFLSGQSQQGGSVITHAGEFHIANIDGYFFMGASRARAISNDAPRLQGEEQLVPTNLPVPVYRGSSEGDVRNGSTRQDDADTSAFASFRLIEVPGTSHNPVHKVNILGFPLSFFCVNEAASLADGPVFGSYVWNAMWENMRIQVDDGITPPNAPRIDIVGGVIQRDEFANATGGVRLPEMDVPTSSYFSPNNVGKPLCVDPGAPPFPSCIPSVPGLPDFFLRLIAGLGCGLVGSQEPFDEQMMSEMYVERDFYRDMVEERAEALTAARFLLEDDERKIVSTGDEVDFPELEEEDDD